MPLSLCSSLGFIVAEKLGEVVKLRLGAHSFQITFGEFGFGI
jgi:hypothetical protein